MGTAVNDKITMTEIDALRDRIYAENDRRTTRSFLSGTVYNDNVSKLGTSGLSAGNTAKTLHAQNYNLAANALADAGDTYPPGYIDISSWFAVGQKITSNGYAQMASNVGQLELQCNCDTYADACTCNSQKSCACDGVRTCCNGNCGTCVNNYTHCCNANCCNGRCTQQHCGCHAITYPNNCTCNKVCSCQFN